MIRNKTPHLIQQKQRKRTFRTQQSQPLPPQPYWFEQYYINKEQLQSIGRNSTFLRLQADRIINNMVAQYQVNPTVYARGNLQKIISDNCRAIEAVEGWLRGFRGIDQRTAAGKTERAMVSHFQNTLSQQVISLFNSKQQLSSITNQLSQPRSFLNTSYQNPLNLSTEQQYHQDRNRSFAQINNRIENLNTVMKRMNTMVVGQGDLINRIDQNLEQGKNYMKDANQQLGMRVRREQGEGEFTCEGKVNKAITGLYVLNLGILVLFLLKHLIF